jgi:TnpA family transposase
MYISNNINIKAQDSCSSKQIIHMLNNFYVEYITMVAKGNFTNEERDLFLAKYCTKNMMDYLENCKCEYDPFLGAQDADSLSLKTLIIKKDTNNNNLYRVSYIDYYSKVKSNIGLFIVKQKECYKIDSFW